MPHFSSSNALGSVIHHEIFLAGHHLTLDNVDTFEPELTISREEMAVIMQRFAEKTGKVLNGTQAAGKFTDQKKIAPWAQDAVQEMQQAGVLSGKRLGRFDPTGATTRAEAAAVLERFTKN